MNSLLPFMLPLGAIVAVAIVMISLGLIFLAAGKDGTIIIGLVIIILVPLVGALLTRGSKETPG